MPSANDRLLDLDIRHQIGLQRFGTSTVRKMLALLTQAEADIVSQIEALSWEGVARENYRRQRLEKMLEGIRATMEEAYGELNGELRTDLLGLATYEGEYQAESIRKAIGETDVGFSVQPTKEQLKAAVDSRPFQGRVLKEWGADLNDNAFKRVRDAIRIGYIEGESIPNIVKRIRGTKALRFKDGILDISRRGAEGLVRTAITHTAMVAKEEFFKVNPDTVKAVRWSSVLDSRTTPVCRARDGKTYAVGKGPRPPAHWRCLQGDALITTRAPITGASKRWFDGQVIVIRTAAGHEITCTPNHPVLTSEGWLPAEGVDLSMKVVCDFGGQRPTALINGQHKHMPSRIEEIADAFFGSEMMVPVPMPTAAEDFHGDGVEGDVAIVGSNSLLEAANETALLQQAGKAAVIMGDASLAIFARDGGLAEAFTADGSTAASSIRICGKTLALIERSSIHSSLLLSTSTAKRDAALREDPLDRTWRDAEFYSDATNAASRSIFFDDVTAVERRDFSDHVYNLEVENSVIISNGIVTHNCRSTIVAVLDGDEAEDETYQTWLSKQSAEMQDDILGRAKGRLFRQGGITLDRFVNRAGEELTLEQLRIREAEAFTRAGIAA